MAKIPVLKPKLPSFDKLTEFLTQIDNNRWYTNNGPLTQQFEKKLANHFEVQDSNLVSVSNGTSALAVGLLSFDENIKAKPYCLMPSWTFAATPIAALMCGLEPVFCDVDKDTWTLTPELVFKCLAELGIDFSKVHSVIPVSPFGAPIDLGTWEVFKLSTKINVLVDAAASFDSVNTFQSFTRSTIPIMISLHATKVFGVGEGALIISNDQDFILRIRKRTNFGFWGKRESEVFGFNAKPSEYTSAVGLAELKDWDIKRQKWQDCTNSYLKYAEELSHHGISFFPGYGNGWISSYCNVIFNDQKKKDVVIQNLTKGEIDFREWWGKGAHEQKTFSKFKRSSLPITEQLAMHSLGLPFYTDLSETEIETIIRICTEI